MRHPVVTLASAGALVLPIISLVVKQFVCETHNPADAKVRAKARIAAPKLKRRAVGTTAASAAGNCDGSQEVAGSAAADDRDHLADAVLGRSGGYELFTEDEVEALQQAEANPAALLSLLQQYSSRMTPVQLLEEEDYSDDMSLWFTDDPEQHDWQHDSPISNGEAQQQHQLRVVPFGAVDDDDDDDDGEVSSTRSAAGASLQQQQQRQQAHSQEQALMQLAAAVQQQQQHQGDTYNAASDAAADAAAAGASAYFDDSYFGLPADSTAATPADLQELQLAVSRNLEALLPKDSSTWAGSYPPRFDELLSPQQQQQQQQGAGTAGPSRLPLPPPMLQEPPEFDFDDFDYLPDFDYVPDFEAEFDDEDMFDFDLQP